MTTTPTTYRKKPVEIQAMHFETVLDGALIAEWAGGSNEASPHEVQIKTLEGTMTASLGDYVIRGVQGEFYPCKPDIFAATYEEVTA
ncbi:hypothetical protein [Microbacterium sp. 22296]|uniref:hypothetical protein n=1 Tax=Microbacterium sp. 22296 TaxID=3453903 RepID=UPI003F824441